MHPDILCVLAGAHMQAAIDEARQRQLVVAARRHPSVPSARSRTLAVTRPVRRLRAVRA